MESKVTKREDYYIIGTTNPYQASHGRHSGFFRRRTIRAVNDVLYLTREQAHQWVMREAEADFGEYRDNDGYIGVGTLREVAPGDLSYTHDGYSWSLVTIDTMSEVEAEAVLLGVLIDDETKEAIYARHPELKPETA